MSNKISHRSYKQSPISYSRIARLDQLTKNIPDDIWKKLNLESLFYNKQHCRCYCIKCLENNGKERSPAFQSTKRLGHHIVTNHKIDSEIFPTTAQTLKLLELYSILLQLRLARI